MIESEGGNLTGSEQEILQSLQGSDHKVVDAPKKEAVKHKPKARPKSPRLEQVEEEKEVEHSVLLELKQSFGLGKVKKADIELNGTVFTLKPISSRWAGWSDSMAAALSKDLPEYNSKLDICLAAVCVDSISGTSIEEVFSEDNSKMAYSKLVDFLSDDSSFGLTREINLAYDKIIEPKVKVLSGLGIDEKIGKLIYRCSKCDFAMAHPKGKWFCHKDGTKLVEYKRDNDLPLA